MRNEVPHLLNSFLLTGLRYPVNIQIKALLGHSTMIPLHGRKMPLCLYRVTIRISQMPDERPKEQQHDQEEYRYLESGLTGLPIEARFLASAQRILYEEPNGKAEIRHLRQHQIPAFSSFGDYLLDLATGSEATSISPFCRIILPPRTGKTVVAGRIIDWAGLCSTIVVPTNDLRWL